MFLDVHVEASFISVSWMGVTGDQTYFTGGTGKCLVNLKFRLWEHGMICALEKIIRTEGSM